MATNSRTVLSADASRDERLGAQTKEAPAEHAGVLVWRTERDSNPRTSFPVTRFPSVRLKPLGHLSPRGRGRVPNDGPRATRYSSSQQSPERPPGRDPGGSRGRRSGGGRSRNNRHVSGVGAWNRKTVNPPAPDEPDAQRRRASRAKQLESSIGLFDRRRRWMRVFEDLHR